MTHKHFIQIEGHTQEQLMGLIEKADKIITSNHYQSQQLDTLKNKTVINLFFEPSTRTRASFELAAKRLAATVLNLDIATSATKKGESFHDTISTLLAMHADVLVIRHAENNKAELVVKDFGDQVSVINAGDGTHAHPTQAMLDMLTIYQHKKSFKHLSVAIIGDVLHSRVAQSDIAALKVLGVKDIRLVGPKTLLPHEVSEQGVEIHHDLRTGLNDVDVVMMLRIQKERMQQGLIPDEKDYFAQYGLTLEKLGLAKPDAIVMHPGPMNRDLEIESAVADGKQSVILQQVRNGVAMRMAILDYICN